MWKEYGDTHQEVDKVLVLLPRLFNKSAHALPRPATCVAKACPSVLQTTSGVQMRTLGSQNAHYMDKPQSGKEAHWAKRLLPKANVGSRIAPSWQDSIEGIASSHRVKRFYHARPCI